MVGIVGASMIERPAPITPEERFLFACLMLGAMGRTEETETCPVPAPPTSPYQGNAGQREGESFTAYRIRMRKEQQA